MGIAAILGDRRKFPAVIVSPNFALLEDWARTNDIPFHSRAELLRIPKVQSLYDGIVESVNQNLARFEKLKRVMLVPDEFTADNGALTPTHETAPTRDRRPLPHPDRRALRASRSRHSPITRVLSC